MTLTDDLQATADALASGWPIDRLNRARRAKEVSMTTDKTDEILDRLSAAHGVVRLYSFTHGRDGDFDDAIEVLDSIKECGDRSVTEFVDMLDALSDLLSDAGREIARLDAECAGLRAREGK